jgi:hypothetical protein
MNRAVTVAELAGVTVPSTIRAIDAQLFDELLRLAHASAPVEQLRRAAGDAIIPDGLRAGGRPVADVVGDVRAFAHNVKCALVALERDETVARDRRLKLAEALGL